LYFWVCDSETGRSTQRLVWRGAVALWLMNGGALASAVGAGAVTTDWQIQGMNAAVHESASGTKRRFAAAH
jgi:hypothetical protein